MFVEKFKLRMDKATDTTSASGYVAENSQATPDAKTPEASGNSADKTADDKAKAQGNSGEASASTKSKQAKTPSEQSEKKIPDITGYAADDKSKEGSEGDKSKDAKAEADKADVKDDTPLELDLKGFKDEEVADLTDFAKTHKLSKEQAQALVDKRKEAVDANVKAQAEAETQRQELYKTWEKELQADPEFGGENFKTNVHNVNKLLTDFMPGTTKQLTEQGRRVSAIQMKEFAKIAAKLYSEEEHFEGSGQKGSEERKPWDSYSN